MDGLLDGLEISDMGIIARGRGNGRSISYRNDRFAIVAEDDARGTLS